MTGVQEPLGGLRVLPSDLYRQLGRAFVELIATFFTAGLGAVLQIAIQAIIFRLPSPPRVLVPPSSQRIPIPIPPPFIEIGSPRNGKLLPGIVIRVNNVRATLVVMAIGLLVGKLALFAIDYQARFEISMSEPREGQRVQAFFFAKGSAGRPWGDATDIFLVVHDAETPGAPWIVADSWPVNKGGLWQAQARVPATVPYRGLVRAYAFMSPHGSFEPRQQFGDRPRPRGRGGTTDVVTLVCEVR